MSFSSQGLRPAGSGAAARGGNFGRLALSLAVLVAAMVEGAPALAEEPAGAAPPPAPAATFTPSVEDPYGPPGAAPEAPSAEASAQVNPAQAPAAAPPAQSAQDASSAGAAAPQWVVPPDALAFLKQTAQQEALQKPRRSPEMIGAGITFTALGAAGIGTGISLLLISIAKGVMGGNSWQGFVGGGVASLAVGCVGLPVGIAMLRSGARKIVRDPGSATLWLSPSTLTVTF